MKNNIIFDAAESMRSIDDNGFMHVKMSNISKANVCPYLGRELPNWEEDGLDPERIYYGLRAPEELSKGASTFNGLPLMLEHHATNADNPDKEHTVGSTGTDATFDGTYLKNSLSITDAEAIKAVQDGTAREISCAYRFTPDWTGGTYEQGGEPIHYDFVMRDIRGNHVALVAEGRAGSDVAVADNMPKEIKEKEADQMSEEIKKDIEVKEEVEDKQVEDKKAEDEKAEDKKAETCNDDELTEKMKDPAFKEAFELGVKYGEKKEKADPKRIDADHEKEGEEKYLASDSFKALKEKIVADTKAEVRLEMQALNAAAQKVKPLVGNIVDPMAFDSANAIYKFALEQSGKNAEAYPAEAYAGMVDMLLDAKPSVIATVPVSEHKEAPFMAALKNIQNI